MVDIAPYTGPAVVTLVYVLLYYGFQVHIMNTKNRLAREYKERGEKFDRYFGEDREMLAADRVQLNTLEHMPPFLVLLWMTAVFVSPTWATWGGVAYVLARAGYPIVLGRRLGRGVRATIFVSTGVGYLVLAGFSALLIKALVAG